MGQEIVLSFLRWLHVLSGILWLGVAYAWVFVLGPTLARADNNFERSFAVPQRRLMGLARWASLFAWISGVILLGMLYHGGGRMFEDSSDGWNAAAGISVLFVFLGFGLYDLLARLAFFNDLRKLGAFGLLLTVVLVEVMSGPAGMGYSAVMIHVGTLFGTIMVANLWMRLWPATRSALASIEQGTPLDEQRLRQAASRGRHNAYLSVPLLWTMLGQHSVVPGAFSNLWFYGVLVVSWGLVAHLESRLRK